jgi:hypothetical protein
MTFPFSKLALLFPPGLPVNHLHPASFIVSKSSPNSPICSFYFENTDEIPVTDMDRAINSYQGLLGVELQRNPMGDSDMAWFTWVEGGDGRERLISPHLKE